MADAEEVRRTILDVLANFKSRQGNRVELPVSEAGQLTDEIYEALRARGWLSEISDSSHYHRVQLTASAAKFASGAHLSALPGLLHGPALRNLDVPGSSRRRSQPVALAADRGLPDL